MNRTPSQPAQRRTPRSRRDSRPLRTVLAVTAAGLVVALSASTALAAPLRQEEGTTQPLWTVLLPLAAAAIAVERIVELVWNYIDWFLLNVRNWQPAQIKSPQYIQFKSGTSMVLGFVFGIMLANYAGMRLLQHLSPLAPGFLDAVPQAWDAIITGIIIGAGAKPMHDLLGIITQTRNLLGNAAIKQRELAGAAVADGVLKMAQSEAQGLIEVPGLGPSPIARPGQPHDEDGQPIESTSAAKQYLEITRNSTAF
jgi:hypothetical protein